MNKILIAVLILLGIATRLIPHPPNFTPILSIALLSGLYFKNRFSILIPILIMLVSDIIIGGHSTTVWVYSSILAVYLIGQFLIKNQSFKNVMASSVLSSFVFFIITNLGVWVVGYPNNFAGLTACFIAALPFYKNTLLSAMMYTALIHGGYVYLAKYSLRFQENK